jgi:cytochrome c-type biogenesis protein CcmH
VLEGRNNLIALLLALSAWAASASTATSTDPALDERVQRVTTELRCPVCQNQTIADSHAELAVQLRNEVRQQLSQGATEAQVRDFMVERYGDFVLYRPPVNLQTGLLWGGPAILLLIALGVLGLHIRHRQRDLALSPDYAWADAWADAEPQPDPAPPAASIARLADPAPAATDDTSRIHLALTGLLVIWLTATGLYALFGNPAVLNDSAAPAASAASTAPTEDPAVWLQKARTLAEQGDFAAAVSAYQKRLSLAAPDADLLTDYAVALGLAANPPSLSGPPEAALAQALELNPRHIQALALSARAALERNDPARTVALWQRLLAVLPPGDPMRAEIEARLAQKPAGR